MWGIFLFIALSYLIVRLWNFPWRGALSDLFGLVPGGNRPATTSKVAVSPSSAISYEPPAPVEKKPFFPVRRARTFALSPAYSGAGGSPQLSSTMYYRTENRGRRQYAERNSPEAVADVENGHTTLENIPEAIR